MCRKDIGHEQPAQKEERGRKRRLGENEHPNASWKHSRSISSCSSSSVATISTNLSRSPLRSPKTLDAKHESSFTNHVGLGKRRRRSIASSMSHTSESSIERRRDRSRDNDRNTRRRRSSMSPEIRGRERGRDDAAGKTANKGLTKIPQRIRNSRSSSFSYSSESSYERRRRNKSTDYNKHNASRSSISPDSERNDQNFLGKRSNRRTKSRSYSRDRSQIARNRQSMTPGASSHQGKNKSEAIVTKNHKPRLSNDNDRYGSSFRGPDRDDLRPTRSVPFSRASRKERSLSPFSKRLALTQAMNR